MTRGRSKTIIEKIASDIPAYQEEQLDLGTKIPHNGQKSRANRPRSSSLAPPKTGPESSVTAPQNPFFLSPLTSEETQGLWTQYVDSIDYDCLLDSQQIQLINQLDTDEVYTFQQICAANKAQVHQYIEETESILESVNSLTLKYDQIASGTSDFDKESSDLLAKQASFTHKHQQINEYLKHFENLDSITRNLSRSGFNLLNQRRDFFKNSILRQLDESIVFFNEHPDFKDIESYQSRFRQCMTRALTLVKGYLISEIKSLSDSINSKLKSNSTTDSSISIELLVYNEFTSYLSANQANFNDLVMEILLRIPGHKEYQGLLNEVLTHYFQIRLDLLHEYFSKSTYLQGLMPGASKDLVQSCQDQISYYKKVIEKEYSIFQSFFPPMAGQQSQFIEEQFYQFCGNLLEPFYDCVRHITLKETNIGSLCQLTTLLQKYYEFEDENDFSDANSMVSSRKPEEAINFGHLFEPVLHDVQSRLIFRIQYYVDEKLMKYVPRPEDLEIGQRKRSRTKSTSLPQENTENTDVSSKVEDSSSSLDEFYTENYFPEVYLPLGKALTLLSNIYELINSVVFDDLAHYIVHSCIRLLKGEFYKLSLTHLGVIDTKLHYLKNLIILKSQLNNFDIQYIRTDYTIDFTSGISEVIQILRNGDFSFRENGIIDLVKKSAPKIINNMIDANYEIETELNNAVNDFIKECSNSICEPILINDVSTLSNPLSRSVRFKANLSLKIPSTYKQIKTFLGDEKVVQFLMDNLTGLVLNRYEMFYKYLMDNLDKIDEKVKEEQVNEITEVEGVYGSLNDLVLSLYEKEEVAFDESILDET